ncbi:MAG: trypsin-like serine protease [Elusimicrobia bacterium]|nr:trypsin-like serine protease [Elusimicrobiota bacterium]
MSRRSLAAPVAALALAVVVRAASAGRIPNGIPSRDVPAVVELEIEDRFRCTGTVVGPDTVLTAAHCLLESDPHAPDIDVLFVDGTKRRAVRSLSHPRYDAAEKERVNDVVLGAGAWAELSPAERERVRAAALSNMADASHDLAVMLLDGQAPAEARLPVKLLGSSAEHQGRAVTVMGYGQNDLTAWFMDGSGARRSGTNVVRAVWEGLLLTAGMPRDRVYRWGGLATRPDGGEAGIGHGDSGGPMLDAHGVVGVNVAFVTAAAQFEAIDEALGPEGAELVRLTRGGERMLNVTASLSDPANAAFLRLAVAHGYRVDFWTPPPAKTSPVSPASESLERLRSGVPLD